MLPVLLLLHKVMLIQIHLQLAVPVHATCVSCLVYERLTAYM